MKKIISLVLALLIPLLGCATTSPTERITASIHAVEESEWVDLASPRRSPESARQILEEATGSGRDLLRVFTSDGDTVVVKDPTIWEDIIYSRGEVDFLRVFTSDGDTVLSIDDRRSPENIINSMEGVVGVQVVVEESIALEDVVRWQAADAPSTVSPSEFFGVIIAVGAVFGFDALAFDGAILKAIISLLSS